MGLSFRLHNPLFTFPLTLQHARRDPTQGSRTMLERIPARVLLLDGLNCCVSALGYETGKETAGQDCAANVFRSAKHDRGHFFATLCEGLNMYAD